MPDPERQWLRFGDGSGVGQKFEDLANPEPGTQESGDRVPGDLPLCVDQVLWQVPMQAYLTRVS